MDIGAMAGSFFPTALHVGVALFSQLSIPATAETALVKIYTIRSIL